MIKALIVVDMQNDFIDGTLGSPEAQAIVPNVVNKIKKYENTDTLILFTKDTHYDNYEETQEGKNLPVSHCKYMTPGWSINKEISGTFKTGSYCYYSAGDVVNSRVLKETFGTFKLVDILSGVNWDEIEIVGLCTDVCVISNAMILKAAFPETLITIDASCCAGVTKESHKNALEAMKAVQINVINEEPDEIADTSEV